MFLEQLAAIGEIVGAIAIVITLIYLAVQIRDGNRATRVATIQSALESEIHVSTTLAAYSGTWDKVVTGAPLDDGEELRRAILLSTALMTESEKRFHQFQSGYLDHKSWEARQASLCMIVALPIYETWKTTAGAMAHSVSFLGLLEELHRTDRKELS